MLLVVSLFCFTTLFSQTTNISGIVNTYHKIIEVIPAKACIRVADISGLDVNSRVMILQMKGAAVDITNSASFGSVTAYNEAGSYEIGTVCYIIGDSVFLFHNLLNTYNTSSGKVQLVQFGEYYSAYVQDTVKAQSWDSAAGTGGVIAIFADQDLTIDAPIYADSSGYVGGPYLFHSGTCTPIVGTSYFYDPTALGADNGAYKGEGIANVTSANLLGGKGAYSNAGGGGNNHNNSGGGGANLSAGGTGGRNSSSGPFNCNTNNNSGRGGWPLNSFSGTKLFLGGGGGAGHANNGSALLNYGGNGGGIVFIWATNIWGIGSISANGGKGGNSTSDGAGGGGGGGSIILNVNNYSATVSINAKGGEGGLSDNSSVNNRCFGGGGGGSGGVVYFSGPLHSNTIVDGGIAGVEINSLGTCFSRPGVDGTIGTTVSGYAFSRSTDPAGYCRQLLPVELREFTAALLGKKVYLKWEIGNPGEVQQFVVERSSGANRWTPLQTLICDGPTRHYSFTDDNPPSGAIYYRIRFVQLTGRVSYSPIKILRIGDNHDLIVYPNPARDEIIITGSFTNSTELKLMDISGKIIFKQVLQLSPASIRLPQLSPGIYMLQVNSFVQKLIIR